MKMDDEQIYNIESDQSISGKNVYIDINDLKGDNKKYEEQIRLTAKRFCNCCEKLLFNERIQKILKSFETTLYQMVM